MHRNHAPAKKKFACQDLTYTHCIYLCFFYIRSNTGFRNDPQAIDFIDKFRLLGIKAK
jgi:hypothetical protein